MRYLIKGTIQFPDELKSFSKEVEGKSKNHAKQHLYSLFGSNNRMRRNKIKINTITKMDE